MFTFLFRSPVLFAFLVSGFLYSDPVQAAQSRKAIGEIKTVIAESKDTFADLARVYDLGYVEMRAANPGLDPWMPGEGAEIILPMRNLLPSADHEGVVINLPEMRLYYFPEDGGTPQSFPIGIGRDGLSTPTGSTKISWKKEGPTWRPTPRMRDENPDLPPEVPPGPENPMGTHALYLGWPAYAIHGTNKPYGIGRRVSSGCIRMYPEDIVKLFGMVRPGARVQVVDQPIKLAWIDGTLYLEAHPTMRQADEMEQKGVLHSYKLEEEELLTILNAAGEYANAIDWSVLRTEIRERRGYPVPIASLPSPEEDAGDAQEDRVAGNAMKTPAAEGDKRYNE